MAKNHPSLRLILLACLCISSVELYATLRDSVVEIFSSQVGIKERTGKNDGTIVEGYLASVGLRKGNPWCAAFVYWAYNKAGVKGIPRSGYCPNWFQKNVIYSNGIAKKPPDAADVVGIYFSNLGRIAHVGFINVWDDDSNIVITVEGNTSGSGSREGDGVYRKRRLKRQICKISRWL